MIGNLKFLVLAVPLLMAPIASIAATADFTDLNDPAPKFQKTGATTGNITVDGVTIMATSFGGNLVANTTIDAVAPKTTVWGYTLALNNDGLGAGSDDEFETINVGSGETLILGFSEQVFLRGLAFLDLFLGTQGHLNERVNVLFENTVTGFSTSQTFVQNNAVQGGFFSSVVAGAPLVNRLTLTAPQTFNGSNIGDPTNDFAMAALEFSKVPLPAPALLLLGGLAGFAAFRRKAA